MTPTIYYRNSLMEPEELQAAFEAGFLATDCLTLLDKNDFVVPRYSILPFIDDVFNEFSVIECETINSKKQIKLIADLGEWVQLFEDFPGLTPKTYSQYELASLPEGQYILKGGTNSKKQFWKTHMFASSKKEAIKVFSLLAEDSLTGSQPIYIREYISLKTYMVGINDLPITKEFRLFFYKDKIISSGFYWQNYVDELSEVPVLDCPDSFLNKIKACMAGVLDFYVVDIAETATGDWILIELNSGEMSGLSCCDPKELYKNLYKELKCT